MKKYIYIILIVIALFVFMSFFNIILPLILIIVIFITKKEIDKQNKSHLNYSIADFWLSLDEKERFKRLNLELIYRYDSIEYLHKQAVKHNVSKNQNGNYSNRSNMGKTINEKLKEFRNGLSAIEREFNELKSKPSKQWDSFISEMSSDYGVLYSSIVSISTFILLIVIHKPTAICLIPGIIAFFVSYSVFKKKYLNTYPKPPLVTSDNVDSVINF
jgi:hypothetical protein